MPREAVTEGLASSPRRIESVWGRVRRWLFFALVAGTTLAGAAMMWTILRSNGVSLLELFIFTLFVPTFAWIAIAFWTAAAGFLLQLFRRDPLSLARTHRVVPQDEPLTTRTALVMPAFNEAPDRVMAGLAAMIRSLQRTGAGEHFDVYLLSDSTDAELAREEAAAWKALRERLDVATGLYYRRRPANTGRKAGNIEDFCRRWGSHYDFMVVLDADSVMEGRVLVELARTMEANPETGLIQTVPLPALQKTLLGRILQFAACLYSPMLATGQSFWHTDAANYWGHNAIVRVRAFADHCSLPVLPGRPPLGGEILSHDFVEAALLRRAGWRVYLMADLGGSYEEVPGNLLDYARRDRRWAQGSLQHLRLLFTPGLHWLNRVHFTLGAMGYIASLLWMLLLVAGTAYVLVPTLSSGPMLPLGDAPSGGAAAGLQTLLPLLGLTALLLFLPKLLALLLAVTRRVEGFGGPVRLVGSALLELGFSVLTAPLMMIYHSRFVLSVLGGREIHWEPRPQGARAVSWREAWRATAWIMAIGALWAGATLYLSPSFFLWMTPIFPGLLLAAPIIRWTSRRRPEPATGTPRTFTVPSEAAPSRVLRESADPDPLEPMWSREPAPTDPLPPELPLPMPQAVLRRSADRPRASTT